MIKKEKNRHKFGDWLLKQEDEAGFYSYKRDYIVRLREEYLFPVVYGKYFEWLAVLCIIIGIMFNDETVWRACGIILILVVIAMFAMMLKNTDRRNISEEEYIRREFDKTYGSGKYDETMKMIENKKSVHKN